MALMSAAVLVSMTIGCTSGSGRSVSSTSTLSTLISSPGSGGAVSSTSRVAETGARSSGRFSFLYYVLLNGRSFADIHGETQRLIAECMGDRGWNYTPVPYGAIEQSPDYSGPWQAVRDYRLEYGYGLVVTPGSKSTDPNESLVAGLSGNESDSYYRALVGGTEGSGPSSDSCTSTAEGEVYADLPYFDPLYSSLVNDYLEALESNEEFRVALTNWSSCMLSQGYDVASPDGVEQYARDSFLSSASTVEAIRQQENSLAKADLGCYERELAAARLDVDAAIFDEWVESGKLPSSMWDQARARSDAG